MFKGIKARAVMSRDEPYYRGSPCIYHKHSGPSGEAFAWRRSDTHACLECEQEIKDGHFSLDLTAIRSQDKSFAYRFWKSVDIEEWDNCWRWTGKISPSRHLFYMWKRSDVHSSYKHHPIRVVNWLSRGDIALSGVKSLCGERRCCNPLHQIPDFLDDRKISLKKLENERDLLISQLRESEIPQIIVEERNELLEARMEIAYPQMLQQYHDQHVRHLVK